MAPLALLLLSLPFFFLLHNLYYRLPPGPRSTSAASPIGPTPTAPSSPSGSAPPSTSSFPALTSPRRSSRTRISSSSLFTLLLSVKCDFAGNSAKSLLLRKYLRAVSFNNITRIAFGRIHKQGEEMRSIADNRLRLGASRAIAEHVPWLRWLFAKHAGTVSHEKS